jgi:hypothetical protein
MTTPETPEIEWVHCNFCGHETKHAVVARRVVDGSEIVEERFEISWRSTYTMLECLGCEAVCLRHQFRFSEDEEETVTHYPPQISRNQPRWVKDLRINYQGLLHEIYAALQAGSRTLAMMGARAIIDMVMQGKVGDIGGFDQKLDALVNQGFISRKNRDVLAAALEAGSAAAHRGHTASVEEANHVMDIVENLLQSDLLDVAAQSLASTTPRRVPHVPPPGK